MKKITLLLLLVFVSLQFVAQENEGNLYPQDFDKKYEVKVNVLTLLAAKWLDVSYERLLDEESSFGASATINTDSDETDLNYAITPYYRRYFSGKFARGFFVEGFGMLFSAKDDGVFDYNDEEITGFALGVSVGGKFVSAKGFSTELLLGFGRNFLESKNNEAVARIGVSVGYRF
ncbi:hypothetical protein PI23P_05752 [Polaribacter irgensii 23-P]|uniref:DUF3575 domain-containing protein n=1 Tax=Polaribacter irgensii 23-P TaxID=313594 RepID=A4BYD7_9FLAO|nr:DUF3575 domain-containing protein [Polaribacter irgensii]EAR13978.1 hypothetical protein PI23P_05752 [Polaribacter irgensii 23-P]